MHIQAVDVLVGQLGVGQQILETEEEQLPTGHRPIPAIATDVLGLPVPGSPTRGLGSQAEVDQGEPRSTRGGGRRRGRKVQQDVVGVDVSVHAMWRHALQRRAQLPEQLATKVHPLAVGHTVRGLPREVVKRNARDPLHGDGDRPLAVSRGPRLVREEGRAAHAPVLLRGAARRRRAAAAAALGATRELPALRGAESLRGEPLHERGLVLGLLALLLRLALDLLDRGLERRLPGATFLVGPVDGAEAALPQDPVQHEGPAGDDRLAAALLLERLAPARGPRRLAPGRLGPRRPLRRGALRSVLCARLSRRRQWRNVLPPALAPRPRMVEHPCRGAACGLGRHCCPRVGARRRRGRLLRRRLQLRLRGVLCGLRLRGVHLDRLLHDVLPGARGRRGRALRRGARGARGV
mmetsp:Transcript_83535/g.241686  ORF Transcript_83535/g.241686 Transcript_83535/m.241686 type:complete len:408 (+) Transcript_83535:646-1869(+)